MPRSARGRQATLVTLLCTAASLCSAPAAGAAGTARNGAIAFVRSGDIYTAAADGSGLRRLTRSGTASQPAWSPDGQRLAYVSAGYVWTMSPTGDGKVRRWPGRSPSWSPDSTSLAYISTDADARGDIRTFLCDAYIAVVTRPLGGSVEHVLAYDDFLCSGLPPTHRLFRGATTSWSRDGRHVLFGDTVPDGRVNGSVYRGGSSVDDFDLTAPYTCGESRCNWPPPGFSVLATFRPSVTPQVDYAPAGDGYVFTASPRSANGAVHVYVGDRTAGTRRQLGADGHVSYPTYSPDGQFVLYTQHRPGLPSVVKQVRLGSTAPAAVLLTNAEQADQQPLR